MPATAPTSVLTTASVPEAGQLVELRRRQWIVGDVSRSVLTESAAQRSQHLVHVTSIDEGALGEALDVVWEIEPGARVLERAGLPRITGCDDADRLEAFLDAVRWGAATNADRSFLQAPFRSGVTIEDYQLDPLVRAIDMARANLLIADDVGLGKTIETGLVIQELLVRHRARSVLVLCPASLQIKWQTEMQEKFGLEFRIVDTEYLRRLRRERGLHANPWTSFPRLISSIDWMKAGEGLRLAKDILPPHASYPRKFDILVIDEAHNVAPAGAAMYALESQRTRLVRTLAPHFEHRLFLSATPHNGYQESFTSLLELLDDQRFSRNVVPDERQLQRVMVRRLKTDLVDAEGRPLYPKRSLRSLEVEYGTEEREIHRLLREYAESRSRSAKGTEFQFGADFIHKLLKKRLFSSPMAFAITLAKHRASVLGERRSKGRDVLDERILRRAIVQAEEDYSDDRQKENAEHEAVEEAGALAGSLTAEERALLGRLSTWAEANKNRVDSKATSILKWLREHLRTNGDWNERRVILFTEYRATHVWLHQVLTSEGFGGDRLATLHGGTDPEERERVKAAFQADPRVAPVRILLATDAASEGIDLQNHCNWLIHVEIPWNPNVMEQRNGRIDRHGQRQSNVEIWHPVGSATTSAGATVGDLEGDHEYLLRAVQKIEAIREDLGSVGPVIAQQIEEAMLGRRQQLDTTAAEAQAAKARRFVMAERKLKERIGRLHERLKEAKVDFHLSPGAIARSVHVGLSLAEKPPLRLVELAGAASGTVFEMPAWSGSWAKAVKGLEHPHTGVRRPITFDHEVAKGRDDVVLVHLNHPLVQMCLGLLRAQVWALEDLRKLHRVAVRRVSDDVLSVPVVGIWSRLVVTGGNHNRLHEELTLAGGELMGESFSRISQVGRLDNLMQSGIPTGANASVIDALSRSFHGHEQAIRTAIEARSRDRLKYLENTLLRRRDAEIEDLGSVLDELERSLKQQLAEPELQQLSLWPEEQRNQLRRDRAAMENRLGRIPAEKASEAAAIARRYADLADHTFPVAVVFVVPEGFLNAAHPSGSAAA